MAMIWEQEFLRNAVFAAGLVSVVCGLLGPLVVVQRSGYLVGGISHAVLGGVGVALFFGFDPSLGILGAAVLAAFLMGWVQETRSQNVDTVVGALWAVGMAAGVLFLSQTPGYQTDLMGFLFGNILLVPTSDLIFMSVVTALVVLSLFVFRRGLMLMAFDPEWAQLRGLNVRFFHYFFLLLVALATLLLVQLVGMILVIALISMPAAVALAHSPSLSRAFGIAIVLSFLLSCFGLFFAFRLDWPPGPVIVLSAGLLYLGDAVVFSAKRS